MVREITQRLDGRLAEIDQSIAATQAQVREQDAQLDQQIRLLAQRAGIDVTLRESDIPQDRTEHYAAAYRAYQQTDLVRARLLFTEYARRYTGDDNADNAQYWIAKSYQDQQQWQRAVGAYRELIRTYPQSDVLDQALFAMSQAFYELHDCANARTALEALKQNRPQSPMIRDVDRRLRELRSPPRGYCAG
jgi:TolA-binding protein